jgi:hypothetical protein
MMADLKETCGQRVYQSTSTLAVCPHIFFMTSHTRSPYKRGDAVSGGEVIEEFAVRLDLE